MTHFTDIELHRWRQAGPGADRERVVAHLAECAPCAKRYAEMVREQLWNEPPTLSGDASDFAAAGYAAGPRRVNIRWVAGLAAAAAIVAAVVLPQLLRRDAVPPDALHFRGASVHALEPNGTVSLSANAGFVWSSAIAAKRFRIDVSDATHVIYSMESDRSNAPMPPELVSRLAPGAEYSWTVTALDESGRPIAQSERQAFSVATHR